MVRSSGHRQSKTHTIPNHHLRLYCATGESTNAIHSLKRHTTCGCLTLNLRIPRHRSGQQRIEADHIPTAACIADGGNWDSSQEICNRPNNILLPVVLALAASAVVITYLLTRGNDDEADTPAASRSTRSLSVQQSFDESIVTNVSDSFRTRFGRSARFGTADAR